MVDSTQNNLSAQSHTGNVDVQNYEKAALRGASDVLLQQSGPGRSPEPHTRRKSKTSFQLSLSEHIVSFIAMPFWQSVDLHFKKSRMEIQT